MAPMPERKALHHLLQTQPSHRFQSPHLKALLRQLRQLTVRARINVNLLPPFLAQSSGSESGSGYESQAGQLASAATEVKTKSHQPEPAATPAPYAHQPEAPAAAPAPAPQVAPQPAAIPASAPAPPAPRVISTPTITTSIPSAPPAAPAKVAVPAAPQAVAVPPAAPTHEEEYTDETNAEEGGIVAPVFHRQYENGV